jgi:hypothetical protein
VREGDGVVGCHVQHYPYVGEVVVESTVLVVVEGVVEEHQVTHIGSATFVQVAMCLGVGMDRSNRSFQWKSIVGIDRLNEPAAVISVFVGEVLHELLGALGKSFAQSVRTWRTLRALSLRTVGSDPVIALRSLQSNDTWRSRDPQSARTTADE